MVSKLSYRSIFSLLLCSGALFYLFFAPAQAAAATFNVAASADDVNRAPSFDNNKTELDFGLVAGFNFGFGARFTNVNIPNGSTINSAKITFIAGVTRSGTTVNAKIYTENVDNATQITSNNDYDSRAVTTGTNWDNVSAMTAGSSYDTPDIASEIQAVINRSGWTSGNAINIFVKENGSTSGTFRSVASFDNTTYTEPILTIAWTEPVTGSARDRTPPAPSNGKPTGTLGDSATQATLSLETDERAICRYSVQPFVAYELMLNAFSTEELGGLSHTAAVTGLSGDNIYKYYIKCKDQHGNATPDDFLISFSISSDNSPPIIFAEQFAINQNLPPGTTQANIAFTTNESAICRYSAENTSYALMKNTLSNIGGTSHSVAVTGLSDGNSYDYHVKCSDTDGNANTNDFIFSIAVASAVKTLFVTLTAMPASGEPPLNDVDLTARVSNTATGAVKYTFYCDRIDDGVNITSDYKKQYINSGEEQKAENLCDYEKPGIYYPKVIAEREGVIGEARVKITVAEKASELIPEKPVSEMNIEEVRNEIAKIQQKIIELIQQLILLIRAGTV